MNTIFVLIDSIRRDYLGYYGNEWVRTPNLDAFSRRSVVFDQAYIGSYPCMPARREMWTGRFEFPWRGWGPLDPGDKDIGKLLKEKNVLTMAVSDHYHMWHHGSGNYFYDFTGTDFIRGQELDNWVTEQVPITYPASPDRLGAHCGDGAFETYSRNTAHFAVERDYFGPQVFQRTIDWLDRNQDQENFFLLIESFDPHEPFDPPPAYQRMYDPDYDGENIIWPNYGPWTGSDAELNHIRSLYAGELTMVDKWFGRMIDKLETLGLLDETMIVVTTDHGHLFGEHGMMGKPWSGMADGNLYQELVHIPLMIFHPQQVAPNTRISHMVQPVDLYATVLHAFEVEVPSEAHGRSLLPWVTKEESDAPARTHAVFGRFGESINITDGEWTLFLWPSTEDDTPLYWYSPIPPEFGPIRTLNNYDGTRQMVDVPVTNTENALYNIKDDPGQHHNRYEELPDKVAELKAALAQLLKQMDAPPEQLERVGLSSD